VRFGASAVEEDVADEEDVEAVEEDVADEEDVEGDNVVPWVVVLVIVVRVE
jgi:hypothetical protein